MLILAQAIPDRKMFSLVSETKPFRQWQTLNVTFLTKNFLAAPKLALWMDIFVIKVAPSLIP